MNFTLKKLKFLANGEIRVVYFQTNESTGKRRKIDMEFDLMPHVDLCERVKELAPFMAEANDLYSHRPKFKLNPERKKRWEACEDILADLDKEVIASCVPTGISLKGEGDSRSVVITGKHKANQIELAMNTPKMHSVGDTYGFEDKLFVLVDKIVEEARLYAIEEKSSQLKLELEEKKSS